MKRIMMWILPLFFLCSLQYTYGCQYNFGYRPTEKDTKEKVDKILSNNDYKNHLYDKIGSPAHPILYWAIYNNLENKVKALLEKGCDPNKRFGDNSSHILYTICASSKLPSPEVMKLLMKYGTDVSEPIFVDSKMKLSDWVRNAYKIQTDEFKNCRGEPNKDTIAQQLKGTGYSTMISERKKYLWPKLRLLYIKENTDLTILPPEIRNYIAKIVVFGEPPR